MLIRHQENKILFQQGQTLVETVAAIFILVMGVSSALGLAIYANASSTTITKQIIATGLAREGVEAVKNMRDTNWLKQAAVGADKNCYNFASTTPSGIGPAPTSCPGLASTASCCYRQWLYNAAYCSDNTYSAGFCINPDQTGGSTAKELNLTLTGSQPVTDKSWKSTIDSGSGVDPVLYIFSNTDWSSVNFKGLYKNSSSAEYVPSGFYRQITLSTLGANSSGYYNTGSFSGVGPRLEVTSRVWWQDKKCPATTTWPGYGKCSIEIKAFLTNWKTY